MSKISRQVRSDGGFSAAAFAVANQNSMHRHSLAKRFFSHGSHIGKTVENFTKKADDVVYGHEIKAIN